MQQETGYNSTLVLMVCWSWLIPTCKSQLLNFRNLGGLLTSGWQLKIDVKLQFMKLQFMLGVLSQWNQQMLHIRLCSSFPHPCKKLVFKCLLAHCQFLNFSAHEYYLRRCKNSSAWASPTEISIKLVEDVMWA